MKDLTELENSVRNALGAAGYEIAIGRADLFTVEGADRLVPAFNTCFGNNPAAPYIVPAVPHRDDEAYDYGTSMQSMNEDGTFADLYWTYRLREDEALVMFGNLPPEAAFIGYETFLFTRHFDHDNLTSPDMAWLTHAVGAQHQLSPSPDNLLYDNAPIADGNGGYSNAPDRAILFANGPTINRRTLERQIGLDFWGQQAIFSTSADAGFKAALDAQLGNLAGIHVHSPLGKALKMGLTRRDDDFWTLMRYAVPNPENAAESKQWREDVANQLVVFRVSKIKSDAPVVRHPVYDFEEKKANHDEKDLAADLQKVANAVGSALDCGLSQQEVGIPLSMPLHAPSTVPTAMSAVGATNDADYRVTSARNFDGNAVLAVVGVSHTLTGNSSYISLGIYDSGIWKGIRGISQGADYEGPLHGSAEAVFNILGGIPADIKGIDLSKFYVHVLTRPNSGVEPKLVESDYCTEILEQGDPSAGDVVLEPGKRIRISERAYLNPNKEASCGPDYKKLLSMILLAQGPDTPGASSKSARRSAR